MWGPIRKYNNLRGNFRGITFMNSSATWLDLHPWLKKVSEIAGMIGIGSWLALKRRRGETGVVTRVEG